MADSGSSEQRLNDLQQRWREDPNSRIYLQLADEHRKLGQLDDAIHVLERGLQNRSDLSALVALGRCRLEKGEMPHAIQALKAVVQRDSTHLVANKLLIEVYLSGDDAANAGERLEVYRMLNANDPELESLEERLRALREVPIDEEPEVVASAAPTNGSEIYRLPQDIPPAPSLRSLWSDLGVQLAATSPAPTLPEQAPEPTESVPEQAEPAPEQAEPAFEQTGPAPEQVEPALEQTEPVLEPAADLAGETAEPEVLSTLETVEVELSDVAAAEEGESAQEAETASEPLLEVEDQGPEPVSVEPITVEPEAGSPVFEAEDSTLESEEPEPTFEPMPASLEPESPVFETEPAMLEAESVLEPEPAIEPEPAVEPEPAAELEPVLATEPEAFGTEPAAFEADPVFETEPAAFETEPATFETELAPAGDSVIPEAEAPAKPELLAELPGEEPEIPHLEPITAEAPETEALETEALETETPEAIAQSELPGDQPEVPHLEVQADELPEASLEAPELPADQPEVPHLEPVDELTHGAEISEAQPEVAHLEPDEAIEVTPDVEPLVTTPSTLASDLPPSAVSAEPETSETPATATLGDLYLKQGHADEARKIFLQVLEREPGNVAALAGLERIATGESTLDTTPTAEVVAGAEPASVESSLPGVEPPAAASGVEVTAEHLLSRSAPQSPSEGLTAKKIRMLDGYKQLLRGAR